MSTTYIESSLNTSGLKSSRGESLTIVIPALNEEDAIGNTIRRCLEARELIMNTAALEAVEIIVVSDGSTDRTEEIATGFGEAVRVIAFAENRGYGAAIKEGFRQGSGTLVGFLDADGTCDPRYFAEMCRLALDESADVVLGSRMGPESKMPVIRRIGNTVYALILGFLSGRGITDTASGMRVLPRKALVHLYPLPEGLHFTPAMSARALMNGLRVMEIPMRYEERVGRSKLSVFRDGIRFFQAIFAGVLCFRPEKLFLIGFVGCLLSVLMLAARPAELYFTHWYLEEWMIYRFVVCYLAGSLGLLLLLSAALANRLALFSRRRQEANMFWPSLVARLLQGTPLAIILTSLLGLSLAFLWPGIVEYATTWQITLHWSRVIAGAFTLFSALQTAIFALLVQLVAIWQQPSDDLKLHEPQHFA